MDNKNIFHTISYKGQYIQGCYNVTKIKEEIKWNGKEYKSLYAAKIAITKSLKN